MDVEGQEERINMNEKVAPVVFDRSGNPKPPSIDVLRKAREIVEKSGANSEERFNRVVRFPALRSPARFAERFMRRSQLEVLSIR
jgi:hypothetical protein